MNVVAVPITVPMSRGRRLGVVDEIRSAVNEVRKNHPGLGALIDVTAKRREDRVRVVLFFSQSARERK